MASELVVEVEAITAIEVSIGVFIKVSDKNE